MANLAQALSRLGTLQGVQVTGISPIYRTEPQGMADQPWFFNQVVRLAVVPDRSPEGLLADLLAIEQSMGRQRTVKNGPRIIDLDLLTFGDQQRQTPELTLPHPRMGQRAFVLVPLGDIEPEFRFPGGLSLAEALAQVPHRVEQDGQMRTIRQP